MSNNSEELAERIFGILKNNLKSYRCYDEDVKFEDILYQDKSNYQYLKKFIAQEIENYVK